MREDERYLSYLYVFGLDRAEVVLRAYIDPSPTAIARVYIERDLTDIVNKALDKAEQTGDPRIEFELELVPDQIGQEPDRCARAPSRSSAGTRSRAAIWESKIEVRVNEPKGIYEISR